jgi:hypothetical protein
LTPVAVADAELPADAALLADAVLPPAAVELEPLELQAARADTAATAARARTAGLRKAVTGTVL